MCVLMEHLSHLIPKGQFLVGKTFLMSFNSRRMCFCSIEEPLLAGCHCDTSEEGSSRELGEPGVLGENRSG